MIRSMTAYGRGAGSCSGKNFTVEIKSVNNRFFDCTVRLPRAYGYFEEKIKARLQQKGVSRGKVEINVNIEVIESEGTVIALDDAYAESYISALRQLRDRFGLKDDLSVMTVAQNRDLFLVRKPEEDVEREWADFLPTLDEAIDSFLAARAREGENIRADLLGKLEGIKGTVEKIRTLSESNIGAYREKLETRLRQTLDGLDLTIDGQRILTECAIFADKIAVDEEMVRLRSHFGAFEEAMVSEEPVGRRIDFLLQEMNREINTTGSKSNDAEIARLVVDVKCELEKIREQIQNIE